MTSISYRGGHDRVLLLLTALAALGSGACQGADEAHVYRESQAEVARFNTQQEDSYLQIATFVRLADGTLQFPKLLIFHVRRPPTGTVRVELPGGLFQDADPGMPQIFLPVSRTIESYLFLVRNHEVEFGEPNAKAEDEDWSLWQVAASAVSADKPIVIPSIEQLKNSTATAKDEALRRKLADMYFAVKREAEVRASTPITSDDEIEWYNR